MKYFSVIRNCSLFKGIKEEEIDIMFGCMHARFIEYKKGNYIYRIGDDIDKVGLVVKGSVSIDKIDFWGNKSIISKLGEGELFGEAYIGSSTNCLEIEIVADEDSEILFLDISRTLAICSNGCSFHNKVIKNLVYSLASKNLMLTRKLEHITQRSTRNKLLSFLLEQARINNSNSFKIPYDRQQLADYLSVDRSAMSNELSKMQKEGIIEFNKNKFKLLERE